MDWRQTSWVFQGSYDQFHPGAKIPPEPCGHVALEFSDGTFHEFGFGTQALARGLATALDVPFTNCGVAA